MCATGPEVEMRGGKGGETQAEKERERKREKKREREREREKEIPFGAPFGLHFGSKIAPGSGSESESVLRDLILANCSKSPHFYSVFEPPTKSTRAPKDAPRDPQELIPRSI